MKKVLLSLTLGLSLLMGAGLAAAQTATGTDAAATPAVVVAQAASATDAAPAAADAPVVARLRAAGLILIGRTNMTEFAYSGLGINPHYGTPLSPWDREAKRVPGGSVGAS